ELDVLLERRGRDVLAVLELVLLLDAARDVEEAVVVEVAEVAGAEAAVVGEDRFVLFVAVVIADHHVRTVDDDLAVLRIAGRLLVDHDLHAGDRLADRSDAMPAGAVRGRDRARLREAVALVDRDAEGVDELRDVARERRAA